MKNALDYTDGNTVAERAYGRQQDRLFDAYDRRDARRDEFKLTAEDEACQDLMLSNDTYRQQRGFVEYLYEEASWEMARIVAKAVRPDLLPRLYSNDAYDKDVQRVRDLMDEWVEDRTETLIVEGEV